MNKEFVESIMRVEGLFKGKRVEAILAEKGVKMYVLVGKSSKPMKSPGLKHVYAEFDNVNPEQGDQNIFIDEDGLLYVSWNNKKVREIYPAQCRIEDVKKRKQIAEKCKEEDMEIRMVLEGR